MDNKVRKVLQKVSIRNSSCEDNEDSNDGDSFIANTPLQSPAPIPPGHLGKTKKDVPPPKKSRKRKQTRKKSRVTAPSSSCTSPIPPMSPETTKLLNILADEVFAPELNSSSNEHAEQIKIKKALCVSAKKTSKTAVEEPGKEFIEAASSSSRPIQSSTPLSKDIQNKEKEHAFNDHYTYEQDNDGIDDNSSENSISLLTVHADIHIASNELHINDTNIECNKTLITNDVGNGVVNNNALVTISNKLDCEPLSVENPDEKSIDAHHFSPVTPKQLQNNVEISNYDADNDTDYDEEDNGNSIKTPPVPPLLSKPIHPVKSQTMAAPPCLPLTPKPNCYIEKQRRENSPHYDTQLNKNNNNSNNETFDYLASAEEPGETSIEAPPFSPLTPKPCRSTAKQSIQKPSTRSNYLASAEEPGETSIEAPPFSPLTPRPRRSTAKQSIQKPSTRSNYLASAEEPGETSIEAPPFSPLTSRPRRSTAKQSIQKPSTRSNYLASAEEPGETSIEAPPFSPLTPRPRRSTAKQSKLISSLAKSPSPVISYSDDSVKDPDYECEKDNDSDITNFLIRMQMHELENDVADFEFELPNHLDNMDDDATDIELDTSVNGDKNLSDNESEMSASLIRPQMLDMDNNTTDIELDTNIEDTTRSQVTDDSSRIGREYTGRPKRGRKRKYGEMSREERKRRKYSNLSYVNSRKKQVYPKEFIDYRCGCAKNCHELVSTEKRLTAFNKFYALGTYASQNMYLAACVKEQPVKRSYVSQNTTNVSKKKTYSRQYMLQGTAVCREMFVKTLQTTPKRINTSLSKKRSDDPTIDKRGSQAGHNKTPPEQEEFLINIINKLPTYSSHYRRNEVNDAKFLRPDMTFTKIYDLYCKEAALVQMPTMSFEKAKQIFVTKFNLRTKPLKKDTCNKCDSFESRKLNASEEDKVKIEEEHTAHLKFAKNLQSQLKKDMKFAKTDEFTETLTFDLEKTLPLPRISTNIVFYKRQLWVYNLGIHSGSDDQAHCNVWVEGEAGRGAQEVGSCIIKHLTERLKPNVKHVIFWSDSCGGQNRNIKLTLMLKAVLHSHPTLEKISLRFLESGHSFLPNDTDFGRIECALKLQQRLYTPEDYMEIMKHCKKNKPIRVHRMEKHDFVSSSKLESLVTNRKKAEDGSKISWLKTKEILLKKEDMFSIFMRPDLDEETEYTVVNIKKNTRGRQNDLRKELMEPLWPTGKPIPTPKLQDLKSLMHLIPKDVQGFYKNLISDDNIEDDIDGFSGTIDFEFDEGDGDTQ